jgi:phage terminase small subunit
MNKLTLKQEKFCIEYARTGKGVDSYRAAYNAVNSTPDTASRRASDLLRNSRIAARIAELRRPMFEKAAFEIADVLKHWVAIATANPNDLIQNRRTCCRHCYGINHQYQWVESVHALACAKAIHEGKRVPAAPGGFGFNATRPPADDCPVCFGEGIVNVYVADTRTLTGGAKLLYAGLKQTKHGVQVLMRDQDDALRNIAKFLGMFKEKVDQPSGDSGTMPAIGQVTADPVEAARIYQQIMSGD